MDDPGGSTFQLLLIIALLGLSALFSGSETALFSLSHVRLRQLQEKGVKGADLIQRLISTGPNLLSSLLIGNTVVNIWLTSLVTTLMLSLMGGSYGTQVASFAATALTTILLLVFGEVTPKAIAASIPESFSLVVAKPIQLTNWLLTPVVKLFNALTSIGVLADDTHGYAPIVTEDIIKAAVSMSEEEGSLQQEARQMIYGIFASDDITVNKVMVPKQEMTALPLDTPVDDAIQLLLKEGYSRLPVYRDDLDNIVGLIYAKDLLTHLYSQGQVKLQDIVRPVLRCRSTRKLNVLLNEMRAKRIQLCIVTDEHGRTAGLVTMEDLIEEIVGDIIDEYDQESITTSEEEAASC